MKLDLRKIFVVVAAAVAVSMVGGSVANAAVLQIQYTGVDLTYNGSELYDSVSPFGGLGDPTTATPLTTMAFVLDGVPTAILGPGSIFQDLFLGLGAIPVPVGVGSTVVVGGFGINDLLMLPGTGVGPFGTWGLAVDVTMEVFITNLGGGNYFILGQGVGTVFAQDIPGFPQFIDPISVSFSGTTVAGSVTTAGGFFTGFRMTGTGEHSGTLVPEPASCVLLGIGLAFAGVAYRRRKAA